MARLKIFFLALSLGASSAIAQSNSDPGVADQIEELKQQIDQLQKQQTQDQAKYQEDLLKLQQLQAMQEAQRQEELRQQHPDQGAEQQKKLKEQKDSLWPNQQTVVGLTAVGGQNGEPAHYLAQPGTSPENDKENQEKEEFTKAFEQSKAEMMRIYPDAGVDGSPLSKKIAEIADHMRAQGNPLANQADAPLKIAQMAANELGIPPKQ